MVHQQWIKQGMRTLQCLYDAATMMVQEVWFVKIWRYKMSDIMCGSETWNIGHKEKFINDSSHSLWKLELPMIVWYFGKFTQKRFRESFGQLQDMYSILAFNTLCCKMGVLPFDCSLSSSTTWESQIANELCSLNDLDEFHLLHHNDDFISE